MTTLVTIFIIFIVLVGAATPALYIYSRGVRRDRKNYDRGLKMVPLLIHLPPQSDDIQVGGRDVRDVTEENISKAQVLYSIIASTYQKNFKGRYYGQRHIAFEIVAINGFVYFYAAVPVSLIEIVKQAIVSAYPAAQLEEVEEHNIFSKVGKIAATVGGELLLKKSYVYPIATYQDLKRDALQSMLNSLSSLGKEDGVGIQILLRPAEPSWQKTSKRIAASKRKGGGDSTDIFEEAAWYIKNFPLAFFKSPTGEESEKKSKDISGLDQSVVDSIEDKSRYPGFEVAIRVVASSNVESRSQSLLANVVAAFQLFDAQGKNGFKYQPADDIKAFVASYIMRFFRSYKQANILNSVELATIFHFPDQNNIPTSQLSRQESKQVDGPRNIPEEGLMLGYNVFRGAKKPIRLALSDRQRHIYTVGQTGTGKSTFLENLALQDMLAGNGFAFVDPHGDTAEKLLAMVPRERTEDVIYFSPAETDFPMGLNLFEYNTPDQKDFLIQEVLNMLYKLYDPQHQGIMGPRYENIFRNCALVIMADPNGGTFVDIPKLFRDPNFLRQKLQHVTDQNVLDYWLKEYPASQRSNDAGEITAWFVSKFGAFLSNEMMRNIIGQTKSSFNLRDVMDNKKILLVNLSKGRTGDLNSKLLGMIFVMKFQAAAMSRANIPESERVDFCLYVDEFQNFSTDSFATIMSEARKYHLNLVVANQFTTQLTEEIRDAVFGNMGTVVSFRVGQNDAEPLVHYFQPTFDSSDLLRIPNYNTVTRTMVGGVPTQPFSMATLPPLGNPDPQVANALKQLSGAKYGRPRKDVEEEIFERMSVKPIAPSAGGSFSQPAFGSPSGSSATQPWPNPVSPPQTGAKPTFLDEWMAKRSSVAPGSTMPLPVATRSTTSPSLPQPQPPVSSTQLAPLPSLQPISPNPTSAVPPVSGTGAQNSLAQPAAGGINNVALVPTQTGVNPSSDCPTLTPQLSSDSSMQPVPELRPYLPETAAPEFSHPATDPPIQHPAPVANQNEGEIHLHPNSDSAISIDTEGHLVHLNNN